MVCEGTNLEQLQELYFAAEKMKEVNENNIPILEGERDDRKGLQAISLYLCSKNHDYGD